MTRLLKSDLTYSLGGGFILGALALFLMQPADQLAETNQTIASTVAAASALLS